MKLIATPATVRQADELLPAARRLIDAFSDHLCNDPANDVSCKAGCSACCSQPVPVTPAEVRSILDAIDQLDPDVRTKVRARIKATDAALAAAGIDESTFTNAGDDLVARDQAVLQYFRLDVPCPLLQDGVCSVRSDRPLACREYLVKSDPWQCTPQARLESNGEATQVVRIRAKTDVIRGFLEISSELGEDRHSILAFALARPPAAVEPGDPQSGPQLAQRLTRQRQQ